MDGEDEVLRSLVNPAAPYSQAMTSAATAHSGLPTELDPLALADLACRLVVELQPVGEIELALVNDLARQLHGAARAEAGALAVERQTARLLPTLLGMNEIAIMPADHQLAPRNRADESLAAAMHSEYAQRLERLSMDRSRRIFAVLAKLEQFQSRRRERERGKLILPPVGFVDEQACADYLVARRRAGVVPCRRCGEHGGYYLAARRAWECEGCGSQSGLREGTVFAQSPLSLMTWFETIRWMLWQPSIGTRELRRRIGIKRDTTIRSIVHRIRLALLEVDASCRLAGLDVHYFSRPASKLSANIPGPPAGEPRS